MTTTSDPLWRELVIVNELGLHARAAAKLAKAAQQAAGRVWLQTRSERIDAKQVIDILTLAAAQGDQVRVEVENASDGIILENIAELFAGGFGE
jgi:phosphocarrier protein